MRRRLVCSAAATLVVVLAAAGCGGGSSASSDGKIKLSIGLFSDFGYDNLIKEYQASHPNIEVEQRKVKMEQHHTQLATQLAGGRGAADIVAIEEGAMTQFRASKDKFVNLADFGAKDLKDQWVPWKWNQGTDGDFVIGLGTDMGSLGLCYRRDLFEKAGLPTDREAVAKLWPTWGDYLKTADAFTAKTPDVKFVDTARNVYKAILDQTEEGYFAKADDSLILEKSDNVKKAFDQAAELGTKKQTGALEPFSQDWNVALKQGSFATTTCPAWSLALIKAGAGDGAAGLWDVTTAPGGGGNWGGSFLAVPKQGEHTKEAYELAKFLTSPESQKRIFKETGNLPSQPAVYKDAEVTATVNEYFNSAPVGQIFGSSADGLKPTYRGSKDGKVTPIFNTALQRVEQGKQPTADAYAQAVKEAQDAVK